MSVAERASRVALHLPFGGGWGFLSVCRRPSAFRLRFPFRVESTSVSICPDVRF